MKFIKKNKAKIIVIIIVLIALAVILILLKNLLFSSSDGPIYGNRLDGIEDVAIEDDRLTEIESDLFINDGVEAADAYIQGKLINILIDVKELSIKESESILNKTLDSFSDEEKAFYDIQYFVTEKTNEESELYPIIGSKNKLSNKIVWTD